MGFSLLKICVIYFTLDMLDGLTFNNTVLHKQSITGPSFAFKFGLGRFRIVMYSYLIFIINSNPHTDTLHQS